MMRHQFLNCRSLAQLNLIACDDPSKIFSLAQLVFQFETQIHLFKRYFEVLNCDKNDIFRCFWPVTHFISILGHMFINKSYINKMIVVLLSQNRSLYDLPKPI